MDVIEVIIPQKQREKFDEWVSKQIISDPSPELLEIYEIRVLTELSYLKAEKYDSLEHKSELKEIQKRAQNKQVPRNIQNPNFDKLIQFYHNIMKAEDIQETIKLITELKTFLGEIPELPINDFEWRPGYYKPNIDVRCCQDLTMYFNYCLGKKL